MNKKRRLLFKEGSEIVPLNGRKSSNGWPFNRITKFIVKGDYYEGDQKRVKVKITIDKFREYGAIYQRDSYQNAGQGGTIEVFPDAFLPAKTVPSLYSVF